MRAFPQKLGTVLNDVVAIVKKSWNSIKLLQIKNVCETCGCVASKKEAQKILLECCIGYVRVESQKSSPNWWQNLDEIVA